MVSNEVGSKTILRLSPVAIAVGACMCVWKELGTRGMGCSAMLSSGTPV